jgi:crotonobetainyl-CoA:carnitine CoA-transferase CaiB-like acyl-CoA transferase
MVVANSLVIACQQRIYEIKSNQTPLKEKLELSIVNLLKYYGAFFISAKANNMIAQSRGKNILEGGAPFYSVYKCKQGYLAVGNLEPKFYSAMIEGLNLEEE